jgi:hypothetical protein
MPKSSRSLDGEEVKAITGQHGKPVICQQAGFRHVEEKGESDNEQNIVD